MVIDTASTTALLLELYCYANLVCFHQHSSRDKNWFIGIDIPNNSYFKSARFVSGSNSITWKLLISVSSAVEPASPI